MEIFKLVNNFNLRFGDVFNGKKFITHGYFAFCGLR